MPHRSHVPRRRGSCSGFTFVEMLLVIIIIAVVTAVSVPTFVKSMRGNRRRMATRTVIAAGRYARSMAVLHQRPMTLTFDLEAGALTVGGAPPAPKPGEDVEDEGAEEDISPLDGPPVSETEERPGAAVGVKDSLTRILDEITIEYVETSDGERYLEGSCAVVYQSNGRCIPYEIRLVDSTGVGMVIKVDALASAMAVGDGE
jgi:prepilin-type N-terminal cleavage/methylation domain-containing protein